MNHLLSVQVCEFKQARVHNNCAINSSKLLNSTSLTSKVIEHMHHHFHDGDEGADASKHQPEEEDGTEHST